MTRKCEVLSCFEPSALADLNKETAARNDSGHPTIF